MDYFTNLVSVNLAGNNPLVYLFVLIAGIITGFTPCVWPVLPLIVSYIGATKVKSRSRAFLLSLSYTVGLSATFSVLGIISSLTGKMFGSVQSSPWSYIFVGNIILVMAMWFMDIIYIPPPAFSSPDIKGKGFLPAFLLGLVSGIIAAPCTAAVLVIILSYVAIHRNIFFGFTLLFVYGMGLGILVIIFGTFTGFANAFLKSEKISMKVKKIFGIFMFLLSQYFFIKAGKLF
ncbi:MAG: sulfite exporter TauE/SafE family protein [Elusimicrobia bacterium]|nr:sulfite exporter TauE/SafE family protein [Elusimicrobiota bacterium]